MTNQMLKGFKVLELASVLAGPSVGMFLAELGAEVTKIENPKTNGDVTRSWKLPEEDDDATVSAYFSSINYGKRYLQLDLKAEADRSKVYEFVRSSDIVLTNFKPGDPEKLGMTYKIFKELNPVIIHGNISGYGDDIHRAAYDVVIQAETGYMHMNGTPESGPIKMPIALMDMLAAHQLKEGLMLALFNKERTGQGAYVSASLFDAGIAALTNQACNWLMAKHLPQATGSLHPNIAPYGEILYDKIQLPLVLAVGSDTQFAHLCEVLNIPEIATDERFKHNHQRVINRAELITILQKPAATFDRADLLAQLNKLSVPCGAIKNLEEVFNDDLAKALVLEEDIAGITTRRPASVGFKMQQ